MENDCMSMYGVGSRALHPKETHTQTPNHTIDIIFIEYEYDAFCFYLAQSEL